LVVQEDCGWSQHQQQKKKSSSSVLESGASSSFFSGCWVSSSICLFSELGFWVKSITHLFDPWDHKFLLGRGLEKQIKWYLIGLLLLPQIIWLVFILLYLRLAFQKHSVSAWEENPKVHHHHTKCGADNKQTFTCCFTKFYH
jgi:hypothetical protein